MLEEVYNVVAFGPLPKAFYQSLFEPYANMLKKRVNIEVFSDTSNLRKIEDSLKNADVVIGDHTMKIKIDKTLCDMFGNKVKLLQQPSTGFDHIDIEECKMKGIPVSNIGSANSLSVAEYTIAAALILLKRLFLATNSIREGKWLQWELMDIGTYDLFGKTWGIIGMGRQGKELAKRLNAFNVNILYYDKYKLNEKTEKDLNVSYKHMSQLLRDSDIISIHVPLTNETKNMISQKEFRIMKPGSIFINPARGELVDNNALANALKNGIIGGAAVDVFPQEPPDSNDPLVSLLRSDPNVNLILTPHIAGANTDTRMRIIKVSVENVIRVLMGQKPENVVNSD
ncbi:MAG: 2-hydroxyacid dehydrogenase [Caldisphaera sp.]|uniref:2-hydroxyacid dehydrogenase n=1 Tax=Caldisphaera sp. TaxID=2060322 RepID=UPI003D0AC821